MREEGIRVEGWIIGRHYCPAPVATWIHSGRNDLRKDRRVVGSEVVALPFYEDTRMSKRGMKLKNTANN